MAKQQQESVGLNTTPFWFTNATFKDNELGDALKRTQAAFEDGMRTLSDEALHFMRERLDHSSEAVNKLRECKDIPGLLSVQQKWFTDMARDYYEESVRFGEVMRKFISDGFPNGDVTPPK